MARRTNISELVFEDYIRSRRLPYVAVREELRPLVGGRSVKNLDFIVTTPDREHALVDVKGKRHPASNGKHKRYWENWLLAEDVDALDFWESCFGRSFLGLIVFVYEITDPAKRSDFVDVHEFDGRDFGLVAVPGRTFRKHMKVRSEKWKTRSVPIRRFKQIVKPLSSFI